MGSKFSRAVLAAALLTCGADLAHAGTAYTFTLNQTNSSLSYSLTADAPFGSSGSPPVASTLVGREARPRSPRSRLARSGLPPRSRPAARSPPPRTTSSPSPARSPPAAHPHSFHHPPRRHVQARREHRRRHLPTSGSQPQPHRRRLDQRRGQSQQLHVPVLLHREPGLHGALRRAHQLASRRDPTVTSLLAAQPRACRTREPSPPAARTRGTSA